MMQTNTVEFVEVSSKLILAGTLAGVLSAQQRLSFSLFMQLFSMHAINCLCMTNRLGFESTFLL